MFHFIPQGVIKPAMVLGAAFLGHLHGRWMNGVIQKEKDIVLRDEQKKMPMTFPSYTTYATKHHNEQFEGKNYADLEQEKFLDKE